MTADELRNAIQGFFLKQSGLDKDSWNLYVNSILERSIKNVDRFDNQLTQDEEGIYARI